MTHHGEKIDWGAWAITGDDPEFGGTGNADTGDDYGPAPGARAASAPLNSWTYGLSTVPIVLLRSFTLHLECPCGALVHSSHVCGF